MVRENLRFSQWENLRFFLVRENLRFSLARVNLRFSLRENLRFSQRFFRGPRGGGSPEILSKHFPGQGKSEIFPEGGEGGGPLKSNHELFCNYSWLNPKAVFFFIFTNPEVR